MLKLLAFLVGSAGLIYISRASLRTPHGASAPRSHGFYRFFAWECMLALFLVNVEVWFQDPLAWYQVMSWVLLMASLVVLIAGVHSLTSRGKPVAQREAEPQLLAFEKTSALVTSGIYHYIRHPLYSSLFFLTWGTFFKALTWPGLGLALVATMCLIATARADEAECIRFFGSAYQDYMKHTTRFIPYLF